MRHLKDEGMRHNYVYHLRCAMLSPKKTKTFTIYSGHIIIMGHNYGQEAQISQKVGMFLLYIFKATYTLYLGP